MTEEMLRRKYEQDLADLRRRQNNCTHSWGETKYDPEFKEEPTGYEYEGAGSDRWPVATGYRKVEVKRWSRTCTKCGKVEYTKDVVATAYAPKFN